MSCSNKLLRVDNVGKVFKQYKSEWHRIASLAGLGIKPVEVHRVLNSISFSVGRGEAVGVIGQNGAGKSTLLKIITGTLKPSEGFVQLEGRVSAILELGMGFHPDLTGRQNVYHSAGLMGFTPSQIDEVIDEIEAFAEIGEYFDEPVRVYSSGMQMRVAFAVATAWRPELLIVDEALSVGDAYFQHKSFKKIREFREMGTSLLLVSHDRGAIQAICDRAVLIDGGKLVKDGEPEEVVDYYNAIIAKKEDKSTNIIQTKRDDGKVMTFSGDKRVILKSIELKKDGNSVEIVGVGERVTLVICVEVLENIDELVLGYMIKDRLGQSIFGTNTYYLKNTIEHVKSGQQVEFKFDFIANLGSGSYSVTTSAHSGHTHIADNYFWIDNAFVFEVVNLNKDEFVGLAWLPPKLEVNYVR